MKTNDASYVKGRAILDVQFRKALIANPRLIAANYDVSLEEVESILTLFDEETLSSYRELAQQRLEESAEYQKAL
jgi:hypothetical protein